MTHRTPECARERMTSVLRGNHSAHKEWIWKDQEVKLRDRCPQSILVATILERNGSKKTEKFQNIIWSIYSKIREWIITETMSGSSIRIDGRILDFALRCLQGCVEIIVANSYHIKWITWKETDTIDSEWIAELALNDLISPSRILSKEKRDIRALTRLREKLVNERTNHKNGCIKFWILPASGYPHILRIYSESGIKDSQMYLVGVPPEEVVQKYPNDYNHNLMPFWMQSGLNYQHISWSNSNFGYDDRSPER